ncbi:MAG: endonuclease/exonuclease/phosphatase family protein [Deltaproteobacteria bacterium]|nr:endonuclease/exonuclease/phosphatase family protein [Deltaproteobacteria bacterium]
MSHKSYWFSYKLFVFALPVLILLSLSISVESKGKRSITLMAYNVENLFDATHDGEDQKDLAFLPMSEKRKWSKDECAAQRGFYNYLCTNLDWTQEKYEFKLAQIAQVILDYNQSSGADIVMLEELENKRVVKDLWELHLADHGYLEPIHFDSPGFRGLDVAIMSKFPVTLALSHTVDLSDMNKSTRDILEARFLIDNKYELRVAANHWPSLASPQKTRFKAAEVIKKIAKEAEVAGVPFIAMGDFNTLDLDTPNPIFGNIADTDPKNNNVPLVDIHRFLKNLLTFPGGTHYYKGKWNHLDRVLVSKDLFLKESPLQINPFSFKILDRKYLFKEVQENLKGSKKTKIPFRYDFFNDEGFSDHLPITIKLIVDNS